MHLERPFLFDTMFTHARHHCFSFGYQKFTSATVFVTEIQSGIGVSKLCSKSGIADVVSSEIALHGPITGSSNTSTHFNMTFNESSYPAGIVAPIT